MFSTQARFRRSDVIAIHGTSTSYTRTADSGNTLTFHFCQICGSTVYFELNHLPDIVAVPVGAFADPIFPKPRVSVYESRKHAWVITPQGDDIEHID